MTGQEETENNVLVDDNEKISEGKILVKIPRKSAKSGDITGGLPRVTELFEARNPSNPAVVSEIDGVVSFGKIKRGNREIIVKSKFDDIKKYLVKLSNQILVQENDFKTDSEKNLNFVTKEIPNKKEVNDLIFASKVSKHTK